jgi:hypothetical protein
VNINGTNYWPDLFTYEELQQFSLGTWEGKTVRIPTLVEALRTNGTRGPFMADIKVDGSLAWAVSNAVAESGFDTRRLFITAYGIAQGVIYKQTFPQARVFAKYYLFPTNVAWADVDAVAAAGLDGLMLQMQDAQHSTREFVDYLHWHGLRLTLFVHYTQDTFAALQQMVEDGVDYILTMHDEMRSQITWLRPDPQPPALQSWLDAAPGMQLLAWQHERPYPHRLQSSTDLVHWSDVVVPLSCSNAPLSIQCQVPIVGDRRFYRLCFTP